MRVTVVDNYDSFTYNLVEYVSDLRVGGAPSAPPTGSGEERRDDPLEHGGERPTIEVLKNAASFADVRDTDPDALVISPGPGHPKNDRDVGVTRAVLRELSPEVPTLGVCLGLEAAVYEYGGTVGHAPEPVHGKAFPVEHDGTGVFTGLEQGFQAGRYHSLVATEVPDCFVVSATTVHDDGASPAAAGRSESGEGDGDGEELVMGVRHREHPIEAVQFHPESVLTAVGHDVVRNFLVHVAGGDGGGSTRQVGDPESPGAR